MPPANSPTDRSPSGPPGRSIRLPLEPATTQDPYLREIAEAISTTVPDFASTLNIAQSTTEAQVPTSSTIYTAVSTSAHSRSARDVQRPWQIVSRAEEVNETYRDSRLFNEDIWERARYLTEQEFLNRPSETRHQTNMQNQTSTRRVYVGNARASPMGSLLDWTNGRTFRSSPSSDDSDDDLDRVSTVAPNNDIGARRDLHRLERALQSYRSARDGLIRTGRAAEVGAVPTASALRAYWQEDAPAESTARSSAINVLQNQDRVSARQWRSVELRRLYNEANSIPSNTRRKKDRTGRSAAAERVKNSIRYLSQLRHTDAEGGLQLARQLDLDSLYQFEESNSPSDLPMLADNLPVPQYSSWLVPGMVWHGLQSTEREPPQSTVTWASQARRDPQRDIFRRSITRRREMMLGSFQEEIEGLSGSLIDAERYLSDLLQDSTGRWGFARESPSSQRSSQSSHSAESDHWPVKVTIHSVDYDNMTLSGTMSASHMPERISPTRLSTIEHRGSTTSMSSYFTGEIIDFRKQTLETESEGRDYRVGGLDIDASYWARLGPFRQEIEKVRNLRGKSRGEYQEDSRLWNAFRKPARDDSDYKEPPAIPGQATLELETNRNEELTSSSSLFPSQKEESPEIENDEIMARCLGSAKWLDEKLGKEWILMRWKERCFVDSSSPSSSSNQTRTIFTASGSSSSSPHALQPSDSGATTSWGLTISGFYYIALNRLTGEVDGLYYDPGSQPYQALRMIPEGMPLSNILSGKTAKSGSYSPRAFGERKDHICGCSDPNCKEKVGLKRWFPSIELR
ncbi:hypothetical protein PV08_06050 [Exophiala spinifera]|uniref:Post-SET domain-containing protein n=1 Tax=Exophiala spinifera TaxID=91928 RepID=A0A0D2BXM0_9EURO|nr:uncharacterized protein PV08_06050 [Exophiala spinifera]KIW15999.1 hypothetical protein PV08_06050 [Exophiala spinifera]